MNKITTIKFKAKLIKEFSPIGESEQIEKVEDIKVPFLMSNNSVIGIEIKNDYLKKELLPFFDPNITNKIDLSFMDESGSYFNPALLKYCIELINFGLNKKSNKIVEKCIYINVGNNKPMVLENEYIKIYLCNIHH